MAVAPSLDLQLKFEVALIFGIIFVNLDSITIVDLNMPYQSISHLLKEVIRNKGSNISEYFSN